MNDYASENSALKRLAELEWKAEPKDDFIVQQGYFNPGALDRISNDLGLETRAALGFSMIANRTKAMLRKSCAEEVFRLEGLTLKLHTAEHAR